MIRFATPRMEADFYSPRVNALLRDIVLDAAEWAWLLFGWRLTVTSVLRTWALERALKGSGVHVVGRGVDVRTRDVPADRVAKLAGYVNSKWVYDPTRPRLPVLLVKPHGNGPHGHFQTHPKTRLRLGR